MILIWPSLKLCHSETESSEYASDSSDLDPDDVTIEDTLRNHKCRWRNAKPPTPSTHFQGEPFSLPPDNFEEISPSDISTQFWSDDITELLVEQTNLYSVLKNGRSVDTNFAEIEQFLGIQMMMGTIIADTMSKEEVQGITWLYTSCRQHSSRSKQTRQIVQNPTIVRNGSYKLFEGRARRSNVDR